MKKLAILVPTVALIFACSSNTSLQPGQWEFTTKMTDIEVPGAPPAVAAQMKQAMASSAQTQSRCLTPAEAANPGGSLANPSGSAQGCTFSKQTFAGGTIDVAGTCRAPTGGNVETTLTGTYTATEINARIGANVTGGPQQMRMSGTMTARRTGDCPG
jgi:hypothetical protein